jgi:hypothetical protein
MQRIHTEHHSSDRSLPADISLRQEPEEEDDDEEEDAEEDAEEDDGEGDTDGDEGYSE